MPTKEWKFRSRDNIELTANSWLAAEPKAVVILIHGHGEYCLRYEHLAEFLNKNDVSMYAFDHRGHGRSGGKRGHSPSYEAMIGDVADFVKLAQAESAGLPVFVYGHSMGGNLVLNYGFTNPIGVKGVICSSPWIKLAFAPPKSKVMMANLLEKIYPSLTLASGLDASALSHDEELCRKYAADPLVHDLVSVSLYNGMYRNGLNALDKAAGFKMPMLLFHGNQDRLTSFAASKEFAQAAGSNVTFKEWDGLFHETHNEPQKAQVFEYVMNWINAQIV